MAVQPKNLNELPDGGFINTPGTYDVVVTKVINTDDCVTEKGTDFFVLVYSDALGRTIRDSFFDTEGAYYRWKQLGEACQLTEEQKANFDPDMVLGKSLNITVTPQKDKPQYVQVSKLQPTGVIITPPGAEDCPF